MKFSSHYPFFRGIFRIVKSSNLNSKEIGSNLKTSEDSTINADARGLARPACTNYV